MAEIIQHESNRQGRSSRKKLIPVDMTPMCDLGFLLISFFMLATTFSKPNIMDLGLPAKGGEGSKEINYKNQLTFIIGENNRIFYYQKDMKELQKTDLKEASLTGLAITRIIQNFKNSAPSPENFTVIIKPTEDANYSNFVDILDHLAISKTERYGITDLKPQEQTMYREILQ